MDTKTPIPSGEFDKRVLLALEAYRTTVQIVKPPSPVPRFIKNFLKWI